MPLVSVVIPTKNRPAGLERALGSLVEQTLDDFEVVVVNDGGEDVCRVLERYEDRLRIRHHRHETSQGPAGARNTGLSAAQGKHIAYLDDDDVYFPDHLHRLSFALREHNLSAVYSDAQCAHVCTKGGQLNVTRRETIHAQDFSPDILLVKNYIPVLCVMHDRSLLATCGKFDPSLHILEDWEYWIRLSRRCDFGHLPLVTARYHRMAETNTRTNLTVMKRGQFVDSLIHIYLRYRKFVHAKPEVLREQVRYLRHQAHKAALICRIAGDGAEADHLEQLAAELMRSHSQTSFCTLIQKHLARAVPSPA